MSLDTWHNIAQVAGVVLVALTFAVAAATVCGCDLRLGSSTFALEAAHIMWHQAGGPDSVDNGLSLCAIHHKALDRGAIGINDDLTVLISTDLHGQSWLKEWFEIFKGRKLRVPTRSEWLPKKEYLKWHFKQVFRAPARD